MGNVPEVAMIWANEKAQQHGHQIHINTDRRKCQKTIFSEANAVAVDHGHILLLCHIHVCIIMFPLYDMPAL